MATISQALVQDGKTLHKIFTDADELIVAGELNYADFSSPLARKVIYLQRELSIKGSAESLDENKAADFRSRTRRFLTGLKDGSLTAADCAELSMRLKQAFPKLALPKTRK